MKRVLNLHHVSRIFIIRKCLLELFNEIKAFIVDSESILFVFVSVIKFKIISISFFHSFQHFKSIVLK